MEAYRRQGKDTLHFDCCGLDAVYPNSAFLFFPATSATPFKLDGGKLANELLRILEFSADYDIPQIDYIYLCKASESEDIEKSGNLDRDDAYLVAPENYGGDAPSLLDVGVVRTWANYAVEWRGELPEDVFDAFCAYDLAQHVRPSPVYANVTGMSCPDASNVETFEYLAPRMYRGILSEEELETIRKACALADTKAFDDWTVKGRIILTAKGFIEKQAEFSAEGSLLDKVRNLTRLWMAHLAACDWQTDPERDPDKAWERAFTETGLDDAYEAIASGVPVRLIADPLQRAFKKEIKQHQQNAVKKKAR